MHLRRVQSWYLLLDNLNNLDLGHAFCYEGDQIFFFFFEEINDIMQFMSHAFTLPETVKGRCQ